MKQAIVYKVMVQPILIVVEDGEVIDEVVTQPVPVLGKDWPNYSGEQFLKMIEPIIKSIEESEETD